MSGTPADLELSVVLPCLNEADTLATCLDKIRRAMAAEDIAGEMLVADNGSTDGSIELALENGARVVHVAEKGYGNALAGGISAARGRWVIMGDADDSYDFLELPKFVAELRTGADLVQGCRLPGGGGRVLAGAMPWLHRWLGNPFFTALVRRWFGAPVHDVYCGMRGFRRELIGELDLRSPGMEYATEMIIKASLRGKRIAEVPITLHPDGRRSHAPHLRTFRDGWRTLRFFLLCSPRWLFAIPGLSLLSLGVLGYAIALPGLTINSITFDAHTLLFASLFLICGVQSLAFAAATKTFAVSEGLLPEDRWQQRFAAIFSLEKGLVGMAVSSLVGVALLFAAVNQWRLQDFGRLDYAQTMRLVIPGATAIAVGVQVGFASFFISLLGLRRRPEMGSSGK
ncbi:MAG TPA: dolichol-P-glucose synthetase [Verrucomicrobiales bacterium]|nr:dolichol-P-glucose synthetase [Verrucomicrobiales bacterium]